MCMEHSFVLAVEKLLRIEDQVPERARVIRTMFAELTRILNHLLNVTTYALDCGAITPALWGFEQREHLLEFYEAAGGSHYHVNYFRAGGVAKDIPKVARGPHRRLVQAVPQVPPGPRRPADRQPHLQAAHRRYRRDDRRAGDGMGFLRSLHPRLGRAMGPAQVAAL